MPNNLPPFNDLTDAELIQLVQNRNEAAFAELIFRYTPRIWPIIVKNSRQRQDAEEIRSDVWMAVWQNIKGLQKVDSFGEWLQRIAYNACKRYYSSGHRSRDEIPHTHAVLVEHIDQQAIARYRENQLIAEVKEVVHHLPQKVRSVAELYYLESWNIKEIAEALDLPIGTVKTKLRETRALLREEFDVEPKGEVNTMQNRRPAQFNVVSNKNSNDGLSTEIVENNLTQESMQWNLPEDAKVRLGKGKIIEMQYSPDGKLLAVASGIGVWLYDVTTHREASLLTDHTSGVDSLAFSSDGRTFASGNADGTIILSGPIVQLDRSTGAQRMLIGHTHWISSLAFSPDGKTLASDSRDGTIRLWDVITGEERYALKKDSDIATMLSFTSDGETMVSVSWEDKIGLWNSITGEHKQTFTMHPDCSTTGAAFSLGGKTVAIGSDNGTIYLHDLDTGELRMPLTGHGEHVDNLAFSPDGNTLATASWADETIRLWDAHTGKHKKTFTAPHARYVRGLVFSPDGKTLASGSGDGTIRLWDAHTGNEKHTFTGHSERIYSVAFNPNGDIIASGSTNGIINFWDADTGQYIKTLNGLRNGFIEPADSLVFSPDGNTLACGHDGIRLWDVHTGEPKMQLTEHTDTIESIVFSPDGKTLASGSWDNTIRLWGAHTGEPKKTLIGHTKAVQSIAFSPDGRTLASGSDDETIRLWNVDTGKNEMTLVGHTEWIKSIAFSPDGKTIASGGADSTILLWDIGTGKAKMTLTGHTDWVYSIAFSPDGKTITSGCIDATIHLWDTQTGAYQKTLTGHSSRVKSLAFSSDGKTLVSGSDDGSVLLWKINP